MPSSHDVRRFELMIKLRGIADEPVDGSDDISRRTIALRASHLADDIDALIKELLYSDAVLEVATAVRNAKVQRDPRHRVSMLVNDWNAITDAAEKYLTGEVPS